MAAIIETGTMMIARGFWDATTVYAIVYLREQHFFSQSSMSINIQ